ncbi:Cof-type HAD-IIB family hydrolase [Streptomyces sp. NPDC006743]|uniref:Cof-type HAD-IIB family hydrolase n=1 Tax=Streptomyces sp. NPDC006743 TaxID=3154480 RepID=UPI003452A4EE
MHETRTPDTQPPAGTRTPGERRTDGTRTHDAPANAMHIIHFAFECGGFDNRLMRGGLSPLVWNLSREYAARGHRVSLVTPAHGLLGALRRDHAIEELDYVHEHRVPLVLDPKVWPDHPPEITLELTTRAHRLRLEGVDVYFLSDAFLDLLPDRLYPPPGTEGRDLAHFKSLVFQVAGAHFIRRHLGGGPAVVHGFEPYYHYLLPPLFAEDPLLRTVSTVAANAPVTQKVYRPQVERLLALFGVAADLDAPDARPPAEDSAQATMARALAGTRMHVEYGPDHVSFLPLIMAHADLVDFVSPGQRDHCATFRDTPFGSLFATLPLARMVRERADKLLMGGCGISDSWLARDPGAVDRAAVLRSLGLDPARPVFYHAARYAVHHKGQLELMRAVEEVLAADPEVSFVLRFATGGGGAAAPGPANARFQAVADRYPDRVHLDWRLAGEDTLFEQAACADFCVFPSKYELDGFLIAQAEAMACGAVPLATAQTVTAHFGHALPPGDPASTGFALPGSFRDDDPALAGALTARIREAAALWRTDRDAYARLSQRARATARSFTWRHSADLRLAAFADLLGGRRRPYPVQDAVRYGWFDALPATAWTEHRALVARSAAALGDVDAYGRCAPLDETACERLFAAAYARADFVRCARVARAAGRADWAARLRGRCRTRQDAAGRWHVTYTHPGARHVDVAVTGTARASDLESRAEAAASDEAVPAGSGVVLAPLAPAGDGVFRGTLDGPPVGRHLLVMLTLASGRVTWDSIEVAATAGGPEDTAEVNSESSEGSTVFEDSEGTASEGSEGATASEGSEAAVRVTAPVGGPAGTARPAFRLVATDLDGTLLRDDLTVSARTLRALARVRETGARHLVVTGRPATACKQYLAALGYRGLAVCGQGAQLYDAGADRLLTSASLDLDLARSVVERVEAALGTLELGVVTAPPESRFKVTPRFGERVRHGWDVTTDRGLLWTDPIDKLVLHHPGVPEDELESEARRLCGDEVTVVHSVRGMVEVLPPGTTKGAGVARAAELLGLTAAETVAFGDMPNDIPLLAWAGHGVAVGNAHPALRAMADEIAPANDEDGVAVVLERLFGTAEEAGDVGETADVRETRDTGPTGGLRGSSDVGSSGDFRDSHDIGSNGDLRDSRDVGSTGDVGATGGAGEAPRSRPRPVPERGA